MWDSAIRDLLNRLNTACLHERLRCLLDVHLQGPIVDIFGSRFFHTVKKFIVFSEHDDERN
jgi:hypothetical protein